jgi:hypothetical protein
MPALIGVENGPQPFGVKAVAHVFADGVLSLLVACGLLRGRAIRRGVRANFRLMTLGRAGSLSQNDGITRKNSTAACCSGHDQFALKLREAAQDGQHQSAVRRGGVGPCVAQRLETRPVPGPETPSGKPG